MKKLLYILIFVPLTLCGQENYSLSFDGIDEQYVTTNRWFQGINNSYTLSIKAKMDSVIDIYGQYLMIHRAFFKDKSISYNNGEIVFNYRNLAPLNHSYHQPIELGQWYYFSIVANEDSVKFFINSQVVYSAKREYNSDWDEGYYGSSFGGDSYSGGTWGHTINGNIDNVAIWSHDKSGEELENYMNCPPSGNEAGLVGYWNFNEGSGDTVYDYTGNGNHGTIHGASYTDDVPEQYCDENTFISEASLNEGLVAYYPFNGNANDESGNENNGVVNGATLSNDRFENENSAYYFSGEGCETRVDAQVDMSSFEYEMSISFWLFRSGDGCMNPRILEMLGENGAYIQASGDGIYGFDGGIGSSIETDDNNWHHFVLTISDGGYSELFQDAIMVDSGIITPTGIPLDVSNLNGDLAIGRMNHPAWDAFNGKLDDIGIWNRALTENEVLELYLQLEGCTFEVACNYNPDANMADGSCEYVEQGYDCDGNITAEIGDIMEGGYLFYLDETSERGLVAAFEDLGEFEWGCYGVEVSGAEGEATGTGYQNTMEIINQGCVTENGGITAAQVSLDYEVEGYNDWYLPSIYELQTMYEAIGNSEYGFNNSLEATSSYMSSSQVNSNEYFMFDFNGGDIETKLKYEPRVFRLVRAFGNWTMGCMDEAAFNFNSDANMADESCITYEEFLIDSLQQALAVFETVEEDQNYSISFDGDDDYVIIENNGSDLFQNHTQFSISANVKFNSNSVWGIIAEHHESYWESTLSPNQVVGWYLRRNPESENIHFNFYTAQGSITSIESSVIIPLDEWVNVTGVFNGEDSKIYVNGEDVSYNQSIGEYIGNEILTPNDNIMIGNGTWETSMNGKISNLHIWGKALNTQEINQYITCPPVGNESDLYGYWNFNEGIGNTVFDLSGNGNHGVISNVAEFSEDTPESFNGCTDANALNYDETALCDNGSCVYGDNEYSALGSDLDNTNSILNNVIDTWQSSVDLTNSTLDEVSLINQTLISFNTVIDLTEGWNMFGYGCPQPIDVSEGLSSYTDLIIITKDNNGNVYMPEFGFNGIGDFTPGYGYQIKLSESIEGFSLCEDFTVVDNTQIVDIEDNNAQMQNDINCLTGNPEIGDHCYGGIVFYVEESEEGKYGLVAALEDLEGTYEWGCFGQNIEGADGQSIGSGYQNTIDIINQGCMSQNGEITAAQATLNYQANGYSDWFLPSLQELILMYHSIGNNQFNDTSFELEDYSWYWTSTEHDTQNSWNVNFIDGDDDHDKQNEFDNVRPIRAFGYTLGCMDTLACNYNPEANMADGNCTYAEEGYDCDGNIQTSLSFDGINDYLYFNDSLTLTNYSFSGWINLNNTDAYSPIFFIGADGSSSIEIYVQPYSNGLYNKLTVAHNRNLDCADGYKYFSSLTSYYNSWMFLTITFDNGIVKAYYNGIEQIITQGDGVLGDPNCVTNHNIFLGMQNSFEQIFLNGNIDNFAFWDRVLSQHEITNLMDCSPTGNEENLIGYWNFNESEGDTIYNITGNGNHGTINGAVYSTDVPYTDCE